MESALIKRDQMVRRQFQMDMECIQAQVETEEIGVSKEVEEHKDKQDLEETSLIHLLLRLKLEDQN